MSEQAGSMIPQCFYETKWLAVDTETTGLDAHKGDRPFAVSMTTWEGEDFYERWEVDPFTRTVKYTESLEEIIRLLAQRSERGLGTVYHNAPFDIKQLRYAYLSFTGMERNSCPMPVQFVYDTIILAHAANSARATYALKPLSTQLLNIPSDDEHDLQQSVVQARKAGKKLGYKLADEVPADYFLGGRELCRIYAVRDTQRTIRLLKLFLPLYENPQEGPFEKFREIVDMEHELMRAVLRMNLRGVRVDPAKIAELNGYYSSVIEGEQVKLAAMGYGDLNPRSPKQKIEAFAALGFAAEKRKRKAKDGSTKQTVSMDKKALERLCGESDLAKSLLTISEAQHQLNSFIIPFERESVGSDTERLLHPHFNSVGPRTGRMSCSRPNLQNITGENSPLHKTDVALRARECFIPRDGCAWMLADYEQVEIWFAGYLSRDPVICGILEAGKSVHDLTCDRVFGRKADFATNRPMYRKLSKILTFSILYGSGPKALSELLNVSYDEAKAYYKTFWETYRGLRNYADSLEAQIKQNGWARDIFGRVYFLPKDQAFKILNYVIQGGAAGVMKRAFINIRRLLDEKYPTVEPLIVVHDEVGLECPLSLLEAQGDTFVREVIGCMQGNFHELLGLPRPLPVDVSFVIKNWAVKEHYEI